MLTTIDASRREATLQLDPRKKSELGQFLTPVTIAEFMATLFQKNTEPLHLLEAGAGVGSLIAAFLEKQSNKHSTTKITAYEIDEMLLGHLTTNMASYKTFLRQQNINIEINLVQKDFIPEAVSIIENGKAKVFTHALLNPPYKKINSNGDHRKLLRRVHFETVNLYSAFVGLALMLLKEKGELVAIIPRSFCNGNYYKAFRNLIINNAAIKHIHLFESRNQAFKEDEVLQENIIIHLQKGVQQEEVTVSLSEDATLKHYSKKKYPFSKIVKHDDSELFIHIPHFDEKYLENSEPFKYTLKDLGIEVSTGPVVDFRAKEYLLQDPKGNSVPLLYPIHFNGKEIDWPKQSKKPNAIIHNANTSKMLFPNGFYTVVRRFSSKEEKQRIIARVINPNKLSFDFIGIENHLNVFHFKKTGIAEDMAYGLAAYLNSAFVDLYFRTFNGHTQVNATDLRQMKYPSVPNLINLGKWAKKTEDFSQSKIDAQIGAIS